MYWQLMTSKLGYTSNIHMEYTGHTVIRLVTKRVLPNERCLILSYLLGLYTV